MPKHNENIYLLHILDHAKKAVNMTNKQTREDMNKDEKLRLALMHLVTLIGESANRISKETKDKLMPQALDFCKT